MKISELHTHFVIVLVHDIGVHNGGINGMEHYSMPPFVIMHLQSIIYTKVILHINSTHVLLVMYQRWASGDPQWTS
jgi:hypothetical protein